jgi:hypothetical protein
MAKEVQEQIEKVVVPYLLEVGFDGVYPCWRRIHADGIDVISLQLELNCEPRLCVEYGFTSPFVSVQFGTEVVTPENLTTAALKFTGRRRLNPEVIDVQGLVPDYWYSYVDDELESCAKRILSDLPIAEEWWKYMTDKEKIAPTAPAFFKKVERAKS